MIGQVVLISISQETEETQEAASFEGQHRIDFCPSK